jgi:hypothetical protein
MRDSHRTWIAACAGLLALLAVLSPAWAGPGSIGVFSDTGGGSCNVTDVAGVVTVYVVLVGGDGAAYVWFALEESPGLKMTWLNETVQQPLWLGTSRTGIQIGFGTCLSGASHLLTVRYSGTGTTSVCESIRVVAHPARASGQVEVMNCAQVVQGVDFGGAALVRNDGGCDCSVGAEDTSWGRIKALYR